MLLRMSRVIAGSTKDFEDARGGGLKRAGTTLKNVRSAWVAATEVIVDKGRLRMPRAPQGPSSIRTGRDPSIRR